MAQYLIRHIATQEIENAVTTEDPVDLEGPVDLTSYTPPGCELLKYEGPVNLTPPTPTAKYRWNVSAPAWIEEGELQALIISAVARCYPDVDAIYVDAIGNRQVEYTDAEADARAFLAGGDVTENVSCFAASNPTGVAQSNQWAAEQIAARADAFKAAQVAMRAQRFDSQCAMRACATPAELAHVAYLWDQFIAGLRAQLGL